MMHQKGLTKLLEECGELTQIAAKKCAYLDTDIHPDRMGSMNDRLENEIGDVRAAAAFVAEKLHLDIARIEERRREKLNRFRKWDRQEHMPHCACGHAQEDHIYEEGACRPGFECPDKCEKYRFRSVER